MNLQNRKKMILLKSFYRNGKNFRNEYTLNENVYRISFDIKKDFIEGNNFYEIRKENLINVINSQNNRINTVGILSNFKFKMMIASETIDDEGNEHISYKMTYEAKTGCNAHFDRYELQVHGALSDYETLRDNTRGRGIAYETYKN